tara:strand:- start:1657 stop:2412 length:756 start_codon:yes stop_codon:yes gene_type:complete
MRNRFHPVLGNRTIDEQQITPKRGGIYQLCGSGLSGKSMRNYAEAWTAIALMKGEYVHWIDGACRFNPARITECFPDNVPESNNLLRNLFVGRGFTVHQFSSLISRLEHELNITNSKLVIVDGPILMHLDSQIKDREARILLKRTMKILSDLAAEKQISIIVITAGKSYSKRHAGLLQIVDKYVSQRLTGRVQKIGRNQRMYLVHEPTGVSGYREGLGSQESLQHSFTRIFHQQLTAYRYGEMIDSLDEIS